MEESVNIKAGRYLVKHGVGLLFFSTFIAGGGYEIASVDEYSIASQNKYRVAHTGATTHMVLLFAIAAICPLLNLTAEQFGTLKWSLPALGWFNSLGYFFGAVTGHRGLTPVCMTGKSPILFWICEYGPPANIFVNVLFGIAILSLVVTLWILWCGCSNPDQNNKRDK